MLDPIVRFFVAAQSKDRDQEGASAVEYGLLVALIAVIIVTAVALVGTNLSALFNNIAGSLD